MKQVYPQHNLHEELFINQIIKEKESLSTIELIFVDCSANTLWFLNQTEGLVISSYVCISISLIIPKLQRAPPNTVVTSVVITQIKSHRNGID